MLAGLVFIANDKPKEAVMRKKEKIVSETNANRAKMKELGKLCFGKLYDASVITGKTLKTAGNATVSVLKTSYSYVHSACKKISRKFF